MSQQNHNQEQLEAELRKYHDRLNTDLRYFGRNALFIRSKDGTIVPLVLNEAQAYLHEKIEYQRQATGKVRAIIVKGRQQGCTTYISARYYHKASRNPGKAVFILSHEADTTEKLFQMVERYHENCPVQLRPETSVANRRRLVFAGLNSEYFVGTAGNENVGRGGTVQYLHASEAAYYPNAEGFSTGLLQSVPDMSGTEVIIESTANGMDPFLYPLAMDAIAGKNDYIVIFIPWFWQKEYRKEPPPDFRHTPDEAELADLYRLDNAQIYWRRMKIGELKALTSFMREYPCNLMEAFVTSGTSLIKAEAIVRARKSLLKDPHAPLIMAVDPAPRGRSGIAFRQGRAVVEAFALNGYEPMDLVGAIANYINSRRPVKCFIDVGNGYGVVSRLIELGYGDIVVGVHFAEKAIEEGTYLNKRAEMYVLMRDWFYDGEVSIPDDNVIHQEITSMPDIKRTSSGLIKLEPKDKIKADTKISPDVADAIALTFAYPVYRTDLGDRRSWTKKAEKKPTLVTVARRKAQKPSNNSLTIPWR